MSSQQPPRPTATSSGKQAPARPSVNTTNLPPAQKSSSGSAQPTTPVNRTRNTATAQPTTPVNRTRNTANVQPLSRASSSLSQATRTPQPPSRTNSSLNQAAGPLQQPSRTNSSLSQAASQDSAKSRGLPSRAATMSSNAPSIRFKEGDKEDEAFYKAYQEAYQKLAQFVRDRKRKPPRILVITDIEQDYDDLLAIIFLAEMHRMGAVELVGFVANHHPAIERAKFLRTVLHLLGLPDMPVAEGTQGAADLEKHPWDFYYGLKNKTFREATWNETESFRKGSDLIQELADAPGTPLTVLLISSLQDIGEFFGTHSGTFLHDKFAKFVSQGGYEVKQPAPGTVSITPDERMTNNTFNLDQAKNYTAGLASHQLPSDAWSREAAKAARLPATFMEQLFALGPIGSHLQWLWLRQEFKFYWDPYNWQFLPHLDKGWYLNTRLGLDPKSTEYAELVKNDKLPFTTAKPEIKVIAYDCCAAVGAVGDDFMRAFGVLAPAAKLPAYNLASHNHRVFGKAPGDLGGINPDRLAFVMKTFLLGGLAATAKAASKTLGVSEIEHEAVQSKYDLDTFLGRMMPLMKEIEAGQKKAKGLRDQAAKVAKEEGKGGRYRELMKQVWAEEGKVKVKENALREVPGVRKEEKLPTKAQVPYEQLYQRAMQALGGKAKV